MSQSNKIKKDVYDINLKLSNSDLVIQNFGNGSQRGKDNFTIKPSGIDLKKHNSDDMVTMDFSGNKIEGNLSPSTDEPTHRIIYSTSDFVVELFTLIQNMQLHLHRQGYQLKTSAQLIPIFLNIRY